MFDFTESMQIYCVIMRGGTSKGIFLHRNDLPSDPTLRDRVVLAIFGSPDPRQIDGLGGAEPLTSKVAIIGPSSHPEADVDYTFGQVEIDKPVIHYSGLCGNISSAVGPYAIEEGLVRAVEPVTKVRIHNTNTHQVFIAEVPVSNNQPRVLGDYAIDGVPGTGAKINLDMAGTVGSETGKLFPTGHRSDLIEVEGMGQVEVTIIDLVNPCIFVESRQVGLQGTESPRQFSENPSWLQRLETIRAEGATILGMRDWHPDNPVPFIAFVSPPQPYQDHLTSRVVEPEACDFLSRLLFMGSIHKTYAGSVAVATGAAAAIPGTVVNRVARVQPGQTAIRIGHPGGVMPVEIEASEDQGTGEIRIMRAAFGRTARRIMEGYVFVRADVLKGN